MRFVKHTCVRNQGILGCVLTISSYDLSENSLKFRAIVLVLTQEIERLLLSKDLAAQAAISVDTISDAHAKSTEHNRDDPVTSAPSLFLKHSCLRPHIPSSARTKHEAEIMASKRQFGVIPLLCGWRPMACRNQSPVTLALLAADKFQEPLENEKRHKTTYTAAICPSTVSYECHRPCDPGVFLPSVNTDSFLKAGHPHLIWSGRLMMRSFEVLSSW